MHIGISQVYNQGSAVPGLAPQISETYRSKWLERSTAKIRLSAKLIWIVMIRNDAKAKQSQRWGNNGIKDESTVISVNPENMSMRSKFCLNFQFERIVLANIAPFWSRYGTPPHVSAPAEYQKPAPVR